MHQSAMFWWACGLMMLRQKALLLALKAAKVSLQHSTNTCMILQTDGQAATDVPPGTQKRAHAGPL